MPRKPKSIHYIYKTTCDVTNRYYIGMHSTNNLEDGYMGSGLRLRRSIRKYGEDNHTKEILGFYDNRKLLSEAEKEAITEDMVVDKDCMNLRGGGEGGLPSEEHHKKMRAGTTKWLTNKWKDDDEYRANITQRLLEYTKQLHKDGIISAPDWTGRKHTEETKQKMRDSSKGMGKGISKNAGKANSQYGTCWITRDGSNKKIKKEDLNEYLELGWIKGRKV
tara:strand:- start:321 stop:980 length:660 start_codon:yes stop_codon:yes gene_type:complete